MLALIRMERLIKIIQRYEIIRIGVLKIIKRYQVIKITVLTISKGYMRLLELGF